MKNLRPVQSKHFQHFQYLLYYLLALKRNNTLYEIPAQIDIGFANGKIVREEGYWDISKLMMDIVSLQNSTKAP